METALGLTVFVGGSVLLAQRPPGKLAFLASMWALALGVLVYVVAVEHEPLGSVGWTRPPDGGLKWAALAFVLCLGAFQLIGVLAGRRRRRPSPQTVESPGLWGALVVSVTAGVTEEILFRGYAVERLGEALGSYGVAAVLSAVVFAIGHLYRGPVHALQTLGPGLVLGWLYVRTRNLPLCIAVHTAVDLYAFVVLPRLLARRTAPGPITPTP